MIEVNVTGIPELIKKFAAMGKDAKDELKSAIKIEAELLLTDSKRECPVDTGALRDSGYADEPIESGDSITCEIGYGGTATKVNPTSGLPTTTYAMFVHEDMELKHPVGKAKFLEDPYKARVPKIQENIGNRLKRRLESL